MSSSLPNSQQSTRPVSESVPQSCILTRYLLSVSALIRPGRFDMQVTVPKPDIKGRTEILNWYLKKIKVDPGLCFISDISLEFSIMLEGPSLDLDPL